MRSSSTLRSSATPRSASLMPSRMKPLLRTAPGARASCEAFRIAEILDGLRGAAPPDSEACRCQLRTPQARPTASIAAVQEGRTYWSVRVGLRYRALAAEVDGGHLWFWIGSHADYDKIID